MPLEIEQSKTKQRGILLFIAGILLFASNLRAPITAVGALVPIIRDSLGVSSTVMGAISTLPLIAFAFVSPFAPKIANRLGLEKTIFFSMLLLAIGIVIRSITGISTLFIGTALIGMMVAFGNVLLPGLIKLKFPFKIGLMTGLYALFMNIFGALATGISVPLAHIGPLGWQGALGIWAVLVIITLFIWYPQVKHPSPQPSIDLHQEKKSTTMWTSFTAWQITLFMGLQSLMYFTCLTWLPDILTYHGYAPDQAGWLLSLMLFALIPVNFLIPVIADKLPHQKMLGALTGTLFILGIVGLFSSHIVLIMLAVIFIGIGCGAGYSLSMMFFTLRTKNSHDAAELSGMAQSIGYLLAAFGPILFGGLHDVLDSWLAPLFMLLIIAAVILVTGMLAGRKVVID